MTRVLVLLGLIMGSLGPVSSARAAGTTVSISGTIVDQGGNPIAGATVTVFNIGTEGEMPVVATVTSKPDGTFSVPVGAWCFYAVVASKPSDTSLADALVVVPVNDVSVSGEKLTLALANATGMVKRSNDSPAENSVIAATPIQSNVNPGEQLQASAFGLDMPPTVFVRSDGSFKLHVPAGLYSVKASPAHNDLADSPSLATTIAITSDPNSGELSRVDGLTFKLRAPNVYGKLVIEGSNTPLEGVYIQFSGANGDESEVYSGPGGVFKVAASAGLYTVRTYISWWSAGSSTAISSYEVVRDWTSTWEFTDTATDASSLDKPLRFEVKAPNFRGSIRALRDNSLVADSAMVVEQLGEMRSFVRGQVDPDGRFGYYLEPGDYMAIALPSAENPGKLASSTAYITIGDTGRTTKDFTLAAQSRPPFDMSGVDLSAANPCADESIPYHDEDVMGLTSDGSKILVNSCRNGYPYFSNKVRILDSETGTTIRSFPDATDTATMSRDGSTVAWTLTGESYFDSNQTISIATSPTWEVVTTSIDLPFKPYGNLEIALSADGRKILLTAMDAENQLVLVVCPVDAGLVINCDGAPQIPVENLNPQDLSLSASGDTVAFRSFAGQSQSQVIVHSLGESGWTKDFVQDTADVAPTMSADGKRVIWVDPGGTSIGVRSRSSEISEWGGATYAGPLDERRLSPSIPAIGSVTLSGDGTTVFFVAQVNDLAFNISNGSYSETRRYFTSQLWSYEVGSEEPAQLVSIQSDTKRPLEGYRGWFGEIGSVAVADDGSSFAISSLVGLDESGWDMNRRLFRGVAASNVYEFPESAEIAVTTGSQMIALSWPESSGRGVRYEVSRSPAGGSSPEILTKTSTLLTGLNPSTSYMITVKALDQQGKTGDMLSKGVTTRAARSRTLLATPSAGGKVSMSWESEPQGTNCELRASPTTDNLYPFTKAVTGTTATVVGLASASRWNMSVWCLLGGYSTAITDSTQVDIPAMSITSVAWSTPMTALGRLAVRTGTMTVTMTAEAGRAGTAVITRTLIDGTTDPVEIALVESTPGVYSGSLAIVGTARIEGVVGRLEDGSSTTVSKSSVQPKVTVEGSVSISLTGQVQPGWQVVLSASDGSFAQVKTITEVGSQTVTFSGLKAAKDVRAVLRTGSIEQVDASGAFEVHDGRLETLSLEAKPLVDVVFVATDGDGAPVAGMRVDVSDGRRFWQVTTGDSGRATVPAVRSGTELTAVPRPDNPFAMNVAEIAPITVLSSNTEVPVSVSVRERTMVKGAIRTRENSPVAFASVSLVQTLGLMEMTFTTMANGQGIYEFPSAFAGLQSSLTVTPAQALPDQKSVVTVAPQTVVDFNLDVPVVFMVPVKVYPSNSLTPLPLDWRTAVHYRMAASVNGRSVSSMDLLEVEEGIEGGILPVRGSKGEVFKACFDGYEGGDGKACGQITLPDPSDPISDLRVDLPPVFTVIAKIQKPDNQPYTDALSVSLEPSDDSGQVLWRGFVNGPTVSIPVPTVGSYRIVVRPWSPSWAAYTAHASFAIDMSSASTVELNSPLILERLTRFTSTTDQITANRSTVTPGSSVEFRARWTNEQSSIINGVAKLVVPPDTELSLSSVMVGSAQVPASKITVLGEKGKGQTALVEVGTIGAGTTDTLRWRLMVKSGITATAVTGALSLGSGSDFDPIPSVSVAVEGVTMVTPSEPSSSKFSVRGRAPANSKIEIISDGAVIGRATTSAGGSYVANVALPQRPDGTVYTLFARAGLNSLILESTESQVKLDSLRVKTTYVCMRQQDEQRPDGRRFCFDSALGVAAFPFVYVPGQKLQVEVFTSAPSRVDQVIVWLGETRVVAEKRYVDVAPISGAPSGTGADAFVADFDGYIYRLGALAIELRARPNVPVVPALPDADEAVKYVPAEALSTVPGKPKVTSENSLGGSFTQTIDDPSSSRSDDMEIEASFTASTELPTLGQKSVMDSTGSLVWDLQISNPVMETLSDGTKRMTRTYQFKIPTSSVPGASDIQQNSLRNARQQNLGAVSKALINAVAKSSMEVRFNVVTNGEAVYSAATGGGKYSAVGDLLESIDDCVPGATRSAFISRGRALLDGAAMFDVLNSAVALGSLAVAPATFGAGTVALWAAGFALGKATDYMVDSSTQQLKSDIDAANAAASASEDCREKPKKDKNLDKKTKARDPVATPVWIYDPSGYTYEGVAENRVTGVTATLLGAPDVPEGQECPEVAAWQVVDMSTYDQTNPLITDEDGRYAWDVPEGCWKVQFTKPGYQTSYSAALKVLPPRLDVNVAMIRLTDPTAEGVELKSDGSIDISFDRLMSVNQVVDSISMVKVGTDDEVTVEVAPITPSPSPLGRQLATKFNAVPDSALTAGATYKVMVSTDAVDYADRALAAGNQFTITVPAAPTPPTSSTTSSTTTSTVAPPQPPPATTVPTVSNVFKINKSASRTSVLKLAKITAPSGSKVAMAVASSSKTICKVSGTSVKMLKVGTCKVTVTMTPKKGKAVKKTVTLKAVK